MADFFLFPVNALYIEFIKMNINKKKIRKWIF